MRAPRLVGLLSIALTFTPTQTRAQSLTMAEAVRQALAQDDGVAAAEADLAAAAAGIDVARHSYRPRVDALVQVNRATHNNVSGLLFPQPVIAPISGPPTSANSASSVWGTALGALVSWQPIDFGARRAGIDVARAGEARWQAVSAAVRLDRAARAADAYLSVLAAEATLRAAEAAETRTAALRTVVGALVSAELRPGLDAAASASEHAAATLQVIHARRAVGVARTALAAVVGVAAATALVAPPAPPPGPDASATPDRHPALAGWQAVADEAAARQQAARRSADPVVALQGTVYGRGTGVLDDNTSGAGTDGLGLDAYNWAVGLTVSVPLLEWLNKGDREAVEALRARAAQARRQDAGREIQRQIDAAREERDAARAMAAQVRVIADAARQVAAQAQARYRAGLSGITEVADAERRLAQADIDLGLADLSIWRAQVALVYATADSVDTFLRALP